MPNRHPCPSPPRGPSLPILPPAGADAGSASGAGAARKPRRRRNSRGGSASRGASRDSSRGRNSRSGSTSRDSSRGRSPAAAPRARRPNPPPQPGPEALVAHVTQPATAPGGPLGRKQVGRPALQWLRAGAEVCAAQFLAGDDAARADFELVVAMGPCLHRAPPPAGAEQYCALVECHVPTLWEVCGAAGPAPGVRWKGGGWVARRRRLPGRLGAVAVSYEMRWKPALAAREGAAGP